MGSLDRTISVIGLGYVGLPVAVAFGKRKLTIGFDIDEARLEELRNGRDRTLETSSAELRASQILYTHQPSDLRKADFHIVAIPTPITEAHQPDLTALLDATRTLGKVLKRGDVVVYESTVYPGVTEEECIPILESESGLQCGADFKVGYSPERTNPGDPKHSFATVMKVVSGVDAQALETIAQVYGSVVSPGVIRAPSIKVAEASKVIENTQRDLNIALMNELVLIFDRMGIRTTEVLDVASTKWNFMRFSPGLVGGHCIGVDPYYLTHKAEKMGYIPQVILAGRRINDEMGSFLAQRTIKELIRAGHFIRGAVVTLLGLSFKENVPDMRNSRVMDVIRELHEFGVRCQVHDPFVEAPEAFEKYGIRVIPFESLEPATGVIAAVAHRQFHELTAEQVKKLLLPDGVLMDVKGVFRKLYPELHGTALWFP